MDILLDVLAGIAAGAAVIGAAFVVYDIITKSNIAKKIKEAFSRKRPDKVPTEDKLNELLGAVIKEKQNKSVNVDVFFGNIQAPERENFTLEAEEVADDIQEGDWISFGEDDYSTIDTEGELFYDDEDLYPEFDDDGVPEVVDLDLI